MFRKFVIGGLAILMVALLDACAATQKHPSLAEGANNETPADSPNGVSSPSYPPGSQIANYGQPDDPSNTSMMNPVAYAAPSSAIYYEVAAKAVAAVNTRSENLNMFEDADLYSIDLYGAIQDAYLERRQAQEGKVQSGQ